MARFIRLFGKKRGERRTGAPLAGTVGEAGFFGALFLIGSFCLAAFISAWAASGAAVGWGFGLVLMVLISLILIGGGGVVLAAFTASSSRERRSVIASRAARIDRHDGDDDDEKPPGVPDATILTNSPGVRLRYRLPPIGGGAWKLIAATVFCLLWNGLSSVLVVLAVNSQRSSQPNWFLTVFAVVFLGVGVWAIYYFGRMLSMHAGIGPTAVEISRLPLEPGKSYEIAVLQWGRMALASFDVDLVCDEEAMFSHGTNLRTEMRRVRSLNVLHREKFTIRPTAPLEVVCEFSAPPDAIHSFQSRHNSIHWKLVVRGRPRGWPAFERSFPVVVHPLKEASPTEPWNP